MGTYSWQEPYPWRIWQGSWSRWNAWKDWQPSAQGFGVWNLRPSIRTCRDPQGLSLDAIWVKSLNHGSWWSEAPATVYSIQSAQYSSRLVIWDQEQQPGVTSLDHIRTFRNQACVLQACRREHWKSCLSSWQLLFDWAPLPLKSMRC